MPILTIRLPTELHASFIEECERRELKPGELGRKAIELICQRMVDQSAGEQPSPMSDAQRFVSTRSRLPAVEPRVRGFAIGGGEITREDQMETRQAITTRRRGK